MTGRTKNPYQGMDAFTNAFANAFNPNTNGVANTFAPVTSALTSASTWNSVKTGAELGGMSIVDTLSPVPVFGTGGVIGLSVALSKNGGNLQAPTASADVVARRLYDWRAPDCEIVGVLGGGCCCVAADSLKPM